MAGCGNKWYIEDEEVYETQVRERVSKVINRIKENGGVMRGDTVIEDEVDKF